MKITFLKKIAWKGFFCSAQDPFEIETDKAWDSAELHYVLCFPEDIKISSPISKLWAQKIHGFIQPLMSGNIGAKGNLFFLSPFSVFKNWQILPSHTFPWKVQSKRLVLPVRCWELVVKEQSTCVTRGAFFWKVVKHLGAGDPVSKIRTGYANCWFWRIEIFFSKWLRTVFW